MSKSRGDGKQESQALQPHVKRRDLDLKKLRLT